MAGPVSWPPRVWSWSDDIMWDEYEETGRWTKLERLMRDVEHKSRARDDAVAYMTSCNGGRPTDMKEYRDHERMGRVIESDTMVCFLPDDGGSNVYYTREEWETMRTGSKAKLIGAILSKHTIHAVSVGKRTTEKREGDPDVYEVHWSDVAVGARAGRPETSLAPDLLEELTLRMSASKLRAFFPKSEGYAEVWAW